MGIGEDEWTVEDKLDQVLMERRRGWMSLRVLEPLQSSDLYQSCLLPDSLPGQRISIIFVYSESVISTALTEETL